MSTPHSPEPFGTPSKSQRHLKPVEDKSKETPYIMTQELHLSDEEGLDEAFDSANEDAGTHPELLAGLQLYAQTIIKKVRDGKSVTKINKEGIVNAAHKIISIAKQLETIGGHRRTAPTTTKIDIDRDEIISKVRDVVREEVTKICGSLPHIHPPTQAHASFAEVAARGKNSNPRHNLSQNPPTTKPAIIISSKQEVRNPAETLQKWKKMINFKNTNYSPAGIRLVSNNKVRVEFDNETQRDETLQRTNTSDSEIEAEPSKTLSPMVIVKGISKDTPPQSITETILTQNEYTNDNTVTPLKPELTLKFIKNNKNSNLYNAVFLTSPRIFNDMITKGRINIDHQRVHVEEHVPLLQCLKCLQFGHTRSRCPKEHPTCSHCSSQTHTYKDCPVKNDPSKNCCINCLLFNKKNQINKTPNHSATSNRCPKIIFMTERVRTRVAYEQTQH